MKTWLLAIVLGLLAVCPLFAMVYYVTRQDRVPPPVVQAPADENTQGVLSFDEPFELNVDAEYEVLAAKVEDGYIFQLYLKDGTTHGNRVEAHLPVATKEGAKEVVTEWLKNTTSPPPTVILRRKVRGYWIVEFVLTVDNRRVSLVHLLKGRNLLLEPLLNL